jgi:hypothetical protein
MPFLASLEGLFGYASFLNASQLSPSDIFGLAMWLDATKFTGVSCNAGIASWTDAGPYGFVGTGTNNPTYVTNIINNKPIVRFNGTNQYFNFGNVLNLETNPINVFAMFKYNSASTPNALIGKTSARALAGRWALVKDTGSNLFVVDTGPTVAANYYPDSSTVAQLMEGTWNRSVAAIYKNGSFCNSIAVASSSNLTSTDPLALGVYPNSTGGFASPYAYMNGDVAEILVYNKNVTTYQRQQIEGYLSWKWGQQSNLPLGHPFRTLPPTNTTVPFQPTMLSNLQGWFDGADPIGTGTAPVTGSTITTWVDKSGYARNTSGGTAGFYSNVDGGMIRFNGTTTNYPIASVASNIINQYFTVFAVERLQAATTSRALIGGSGNTTNTNLTLAYLATTASTIRMAYFNNDLDSSPIPAFTTAANQPIRLWSFSQRPTFRSIYINGSNIRSDTNNTLLTAWAGAAIGLQSVTSSYYSGNYHELLFFNGTMAYYDQQEVEGYLAWKWGLQANLPSSHPFYSTRPTTGTTAFQPTMLQNLTMWLDASSSNNFSLTGSSVNTWFDNSGLSNNMTQATAASKPTFITYGSSYAVDFDGTDDFLGSALNINALFNNYNFSIFVVANVNSINTNDATIFENNDAIFSDRSGFMAMYLRSAGPTVGSYNYDLADIRRSAATTFSLNTTAMFNYTLGGGLLGMRLNGGAITTTTANNIIKTTTGLFDIGRNYGSAAKSLDGQVMEMVIYKANLTEFQRQQTEGYLAWKWGVQSNLYLGHPFKSAAPTSAAIPYVPPMLSNLQIWYDGADPLGTGTPPASGTSVSTWNDKSANARHATAGVAANYSNASPAGYMNFDGTSMFYNIPTGAFIVNQYYSVFAVERLQDTIASPQLGRALIGGATAATNQNLNISYINNTANSMIFSQYGPDVTTAVTAFSTATAQPWRLWSFVQNTSSKLIYLNGSLTTSTGSTTNNTLISAWASPTIGRALGLSTYLYEGFIGEIIIYTGQTSVAQRQITEGYLSWKWGLQSNLPAGHPYKNVAPTSANLP